MKLTLLDMVRDILSDMDTEDVQSISDTEESEQVARIVRTTFYELLDRRNWPHLAKFSELSSSADSEKPTHLLLPDNIKELKYINYDTALESDTSANYATMRYVEPFEFVRRSNQLRTDSPNTQIVYDYGGAKFFVSTNLMPTTYTSFDDKHIVLDSYDTRRDSILQTSRNQAAFLLTPAWSNVDDFVPDLPSEAFSGFLAECKSVAFLVLKQEANQKEEQKSRRQSAWMARKAWQVKGGIRYPDYGRKSRKFQGPPFDKNSYIDRIT